jgi:predicted O-methyltransferase YrrM
MNSWIEQLFGNRDLLRMGHLQRVQDRNLGLGWVYYALARVIRPTTVVVIGSWRGFTPIVFAKAQNDNLEGGEVIFIDPSLADDFWMDPAAVERYFASFDAANIVHYRQTTQEFITTDAYRALNDVGIVFVDGFHSEEQARFDFEAFEPRLAANGVVLFHDTARVRNSKFYGADKSYEHRVKCLMQEYARRPDLQVFDLPFADGVTLVRRATPDSPPLGNSTPDMAVTRLS